MIASHLHLSLCENKLQPDCVHLFSYILKPLSCFHFYYSESQEFVNTSQMALVAFSVFQQREGERCAEPISPGGLHRASVGCLPRGRCHRACATVARGCVCGHRATVSKTIAHAAGHFALCSPVEVGRGGRSRDERHCQLEEPLEAM